MQAYEAIKLLKADTKEFLEEYGLKSHLSKLPAALEAELFGDEKKTYEAGKTVTETTDSAKTIILGDPPEVIPEVTTEECPFTKKQILHGIRILGHKSSCWKWRHLVNG